MSFNKKKYPIDRMAKALGFNKSSFYRFRNRPKSKRELDNIKLGEKILKIYENSRKIYGLPRIMEKLRKDGEKVGKNRVHKVKKSLGITGVSRKKKWVKTTDSNHDRRISPNLLNRDFTALKANKVWVSDITYIRTMQGWLYLCIFLDLYSRKIVGWSMQNNMESKLVCDAFTMAIEQRCPQKGLMIHSDQGVQYASNEFRIILAENEMLQSMSRKGDCFDNAVAESFFGTLKNEMEVNVFASPKEAKQYIFDFIECFYNRERLHSFIGYCSPVEFEQKYVA